MRYVLEIEKRVDNISEKTAALIGNDFIDLTSEKIISEEQDENIVFKNVLNNNETFNEAFSINIFDTERSEILNTEFEYEDNLKTALLFYCVKQEIPFFSTFFTTLPAALSIAYSSPYSCTVWYAISKRYWHI